MWKLEHRLAADRSGLVTGPNTARNIEPSVYPASYKVGQRTPLLDSWGGRWCSGVSGYSAR
jgi:hypothetical protein